MTDEMKKRIDAVAAFFAASPDFEETTSPMSNGTRTFRYKPTFRKTYHGTYLNEFSILGYERNEPQLWSDSFAMEYAGVSIYPVYRHNGTSADVTVGIDVYHNHATVGYLKGYFSRKKDSRYAAIVAASSPTDYVKDDSYISVGGCGTRAYHGRIAKTAKDRAIANAVAKAIEAARAFVPRDWSGWARDPANYHADTRAEHETWCAERRKTA